MISIVPGLTALSKCYNLDGSNPSYDATNAFCACNWRGSVTTPANPGRGVPAYNLYDLVGVFDITDHRQVRAGITNLTDEDSVFVSSSQTSTDTSVFDAVGRSYYVGLRFSM